jgi:hypothetical protein
LSKKHKLNGKIGRLFAPEWMYYGWKRKKTMFFNFKKIFFLKLTSFSTKKTYTF